MLGQNMTKIDEHIQRFTAPTWFGDEAELVIDVEEGFNFHDKCIINLSKKYKGDEKAQFPFFTMMYYNGVLTLSGGFGYGVFNWHNPKNSIEWMANLRSGGYIIEKCQASSDFLHQYGHFTSYSSEEAEKDYKDFIENYKKELEEGDYRWDLNFPELDLDSYEIMSISVWETLSKYLHEHDEFFDSCDLENFGIRISPTFQKMWAWFNVAVNLANEKGLLNGFYKSK